MTEVVKRSRMHNFATAALVASPPPLLLPLLFCMHEKFDFPPRERVRVQVCVCVRTNLSALLIYFNLFGTPEAEFLSSRL